MTMMSPDDGRPSISRTARYKKVTKPLLERKRRARINRCLDELKDLMVGAFEVEGDNISKLEKADILELTVRHLTKLHSPRDPAADAKRFQAGFGQCAAEACQFILSMPEIDSQISQNLVNHLRSQIKDKPSDDHVSPRQGFSPQTSPEIKIAWPGPNSVDYEKPTSIQSTLDQRPSIHEYREMPTTSYRKQDRPHVPINQSLVCDTSSSHYNSKISDVSQPMMGLLMTVGNNERDINEKKYLFDRSSVTNNGKGDYDVKKRQNSEVKNVIMQKIREQILGRQIKETLPKYIQPHPNDLVVSQMHQNKYRNDKLNSYVQEEIPCSSIDMRKKSKGEAKHFSPRLEVNHSNYQSANKSEIEDYSQEAINYSLVNRDVNANKNSDYQQKNYTESTTNVRKRCVDYRNMHPKKVFMQPSYSNSEIRYNTSNCQNKIPLENSRTNYSNIEQQQFSNRGYPMEYSNESYSYATDAQNKSSVSPYKPLYNENGNGMSYRHDTQMKRMEMESFHGQGDLQNEQDESMWRPW